MSDTSYDAWAVTSAVLEGIVTTPLFWIWIVSFCVVRQRDDPIRRPFHWMKVAFPLYTIGGILYVLSDAAFIVEESIGSYDSQDSFLTYDQIANRLSDISILFKDIAYVFLLLCMVDLGLSFLYASTRSKKGHNMAIILTGAIALVLSALAIGRLGKMESVWTSYYNDVYVDEYGDAYEYGDFDYNQFLVLNKVASAFDIVLFVLALPLLALAIFVMVRCDPNPALRPCAIIYVVTAVLFLIRNTWELAYDATWLLPQIRVPLYVGALDPILDAWVTFVILVLIFVIGCRKRKGLWSTQQLWMTQDVNAPAVYVQHLSQHRQQPYPDAHSVPPVQQTYGQQLEYGQRFSQENGIKSYPEVASESHDPPAPELV